MFRERTSRLTVAFIVAAALVLVAGGVTVASNMGMKMNKVLVFSGTGQRGSNWTSIPYNNPYQTAAAFCSQMSLTSTGALRATIQTLNEANGQFSQASCGTPQALTLPWLKGKSVNIRQPNVGGAPTNMVIVGSHDSGHTFTIPDAGNGQIGSYWFAVPYHTTAVTAADVCGHFGMTSTGALRGTVQRLDATSGNFTQVSCGTPGAGTLNLVLGEGVNLREPNGPKTSLRPNHF